MHQWRIGREGSLLWIDIIIDIMICTSHVTSLNESCHTYEWVMSRIWMCQVTHMNESCHASEWVMSRIWMSHVTYMNESCHISECVMSRIWMSHVTHLNESCHVYEWVMSHIWLSHVRPAGVYETPARYVPQVSMSHRHVRDALKTDVLQCAAHMNMSCHTCE